MKLHIGCGTIYLRGYLNVDTLAPNVFPAVQRPDLVEKWATTPDKYYERVSVGPSGPQIRETVCDMYGTLPYMVLGKDSVEEILMRQVFEHLSITEAISSLRMFHHSLMPHGKLIIDVPDRDTTIRLLLETGDPLYVRHLMGPRNSPYGYHMMSYTPEGLSELVTEQGFRLLSVDPNIHSYPAICMTFQRREK